jgi:hypothetical protein
MIGSAPAVAQSKSGLQSFPESGIKRIVLLGGSLAERTPARISAQKRAFLPPAKISTKTDITDIDITDIKDNPPFCVSAVGDWPVKSWNQLHAL